MRFDEIYPLNEAYRAWYAIQLSTQIENSMQITYGKILVGVPRSIDCLSNGECIFVESDYWPADTQRANLSTY